jgi:nucleoside-triphosphatase THEP1
MKILLTAPPGLGKSTVIDRVVKKFPGTKTGIVAREILNERGIRSGFTSVNQAGSSRQFMFATDSPTEESIGGLFDVDVSAIDDFVVTELLRGLSGSEPRGNEPAKSSAPSKSPEFAAHLPPSTDGSLIYIDEIGRAQARSERFLAVLRDIFRSGCNVLGSIVYDDEPWSLEFKRDRHVCVVEISENNRDAMPDILLSAFGHQHEFSRLTVSQQDVVYGLFKTLVREEKFVSARKLFDNALGYVTGGKVTEERPDEFSVSGLTRDHKIARNSSGRFSCDCDLANGVGSFAGAAALCSHEMSIKILESRN